MSTTVPMRGVLFDFNGTLFFDSPFHEEAWRQVYRELHGETAQVPGESFFRGPRNDTLIQAIAPSLTAAERDKYSAHKEAIYRKICQSHPEKLHLASGAEKLFAALKKKNIPFTLATASIIDNINFYFESFPLDKWINRALCVYDDGNYANKGEMHLEAARRIGLPLFECLVVEDSVKAIAYAKENKAGKIIGIGEPETHLDLLAAGADYCICDFNEFDLSWVIS